MHKEADTSIHVYVHHRVSVVHVEKLDQRERREIREEKEKLAQKGEMDSLEYLSVDSNTVSPQADQTWVPSCSRVLLV